MADEFKPYDKIPILSRLNISKWACGLRELILVTVCGFLVVLVLVFAGLYGNVQTQLSGEGRASASAVIGQAYCTTKGCLQTAARVQELLNRSVDPCHNFYQYACGGYKPVRRALNYPGQRSVLSDMGTENQERIISVLEQPVQMRDYASERKLKQFFQSCNDMFNREKLRGTPFLTKVLPALGGWKLLGTWDENWDFNTTLKKVHADFWVDAIYSPWVDVDPYDRSASVIELFPGGVGKFMRWSWYTDPSYDKIRLDYKKFIRRVGSLLIRDSVDTPLKNATLQAEYLEEFVNDTFNFERSLAVIQTQTRYTNDPYDEMNKVTLTDLGAETGGVIDWLNQMAYLVNQAEVTGSTKVVIHHREYFKNVTDMITSLPAADRNRMLHNYLIWRVLEWYVQDMSSEYIHANREIYFDLYKRQDFSGQYLACLWRAKFYMADALGSLYINEHFSEDNRDWVTNITTNIKLALQQQLEKTPWLDAATKTYASEKLDKATFKMGYPDWMANQAAVDQMYMMLSVNVSDHFGNMLSANQFMRADWSERLNNPGDNREEWNLPVYATNMGVMFGWNEVIAPAGILQSPIFHRDQPHFSTFGSLGSLLGRFLHHIVDERGKYYDKSGAHMDSGTWWSNSSVEAYKKIRACVVGVYKNVSQTIVQPGGGTIQVPINAEYYTPMAISWTNGVRLSQIGYDDWLKSKGIGEKMLPGVDLTNQQMIYLAHAQTFCTAEDKSFSNYWRRKVPADIQVNMALGQLQEFSDAFKCKPQSPMNHSTKCDYY